MASRIVPCGLIVLAILSPVSVGCVHTVAYSAMELLIFSLLVIHVWSADLSPFRTQGDYLSRTLWLMCPLFLFLLFCLFQMAPLPFRAVAWISPRAAALYGRLGLSSGPSPVWLPLSLSLSATVEGFLKWLAYASVFFLAATLVPERAGGRWVKALFMVVFAIGFAEGLYGLHQYLNQSDYLLWFKKRYYTDCATGTYVNRNHFAGLMNLSLPVSLGLLASSLGLPGRHGGAVKSLKAYFLFLGIVIMVLALTFSMSRMGQISMAAAVLFFAALSLAGSTSLKGYGFLALTTVLCVGLLWAAWKDLKPVEDRWHTVESSYADRRLVWESTSRLAGDFRLAGTGLGSYALAYPPYKPQKYGAILMEHAHNDYLELLSELGVGFVLWLSFFILFFLLTFRYWLRRHNVFSRFVGAGGMAAALAVLVHSLADFNLQIPANAMLLFLIMGLTWRVVCVPVPDWKARPHGAATMTGRRRAAERGALPFAASVLAVLAFCGTTIAGEMRLPALPSLPSLQYDAGGAPPDNMLDTDKLDAVARPTDVQGAPRPEAEGPRPNRFGIRYGQRPRRMEDRIYEGKALSVNTGLADLPPEEQADISPPGLSGTDPGYRWSYYGPRELSHIGFAGPSQWNDHERKKDGH